MPRLVPWIGEENMCARQRCRSKHVSNHLKGIVLDQPQVGEPLLANQFQQAAHSRGVNFHPDEIFLRHACCNFRSSLAHPKADFQNRWRIASESLIKIERYFGVRDAELRTEI